MDVSVVILAGGFGERLWPASSRVFPKQFITPDKELSFLQQALHRACRISSGKTQSAPLPILVITRKDILDTTIKQCADFASGLEQTQRDIFLKKLIVIAEPRSCHTAPPIALACRYIQNLCKTEASVLVLTSDHVIKPLSAFISDVKTAVRQAHEGFFVCFAVRPTKAATGFGYIEAGEPLITQSNKNVYKIASFKEKPDIETAKRYIKSGRYYWNSGMFCFLPSFFMNELHLHAPEVAKHFPESGFADEPEIKKINSVALVANWQYMEDAYRKVPALSVDIAVAERTRKACAIQASFIWHDIGSWEDFAALFDKKETDKDLLKVHTSNCFVYSDIPAVLCGVRDIIVVVKNGNLLILKKDADNLLKEKSVHNFIERLDKRD